MNANTWYKPNPPIASPKAITRLLTETEAAEILGLSIRTLQAWRLTGGGPRYAKIGRLVRYSNADLAAFVEAGARTSTSEGV